MGNGIILTVNHVYFASMKFSRFEKNREIKYTRIFRNGPSPTLGIFVKLCFISFDHEMSVLRWLKKEEVAGKQQNAEIKSLVAAANDAVGDYASYDQCIRAKIGCFACQHGTAAAAVLHQY